MPQLPKIIIAILLLFFASAPLTAQQLSGRVIDARSMEVIPGTHVVNKRNYKGTMTDGEGQFSLKLEWGDTVVFSNIAYKYFYFVYKDSSTALQNVLIELHEQNYLLDEVSIFSYKLTTNKDREIVLQEPDFPKNEELEDGNIINASVANPAEYLYNLFGSKPRQLRILAKLKAEDYYREKLKESNNRSSVTKMTGLSREEMEAFMFYCKYAPVQIRTMNDYEFLISVQRCYAQYVKERKMEDFLRQFD